MLLILPIMLCSDSHSHHLLCFKLCHIHNTCTVGSYIATAVVGSQSSAAMVHSTVQIKLVCSVGPDWGQATYMQEMHSEVYLLCSIMLPGTHYALPATACQKHMQHIVVSLAGTTGLISSPALNNKYGICGSPV